LARKQPLGPAASLKERVAGVREERAAKSAPPEPKPPPDKTIEELRARRRR